MRQNHGMDRYWPLTLALTCFILCEWRINKDVRFTSWLGKTCTSGRSCEMRSSTSTTAVKLHTIKKSACMISYKSGASRVLWCSSCCAAWGAHGQLMSMTIKVLLELRGPVGSGFFAVMSITQALSCGFPHPTSGVTALSTMPPSTSNPNQQDISSLFLSLSLVSSLAKERRWGTPCFWVRIVRGSRSLKCDLSPCRHASVIYSQWRSSLGGVQCCGHLNSALKILTI